MTTYYRDEEVLITDRVFITAVPILMRFPIAKLRNAHVLRYPRRFPWGRATHELRATYGGTELILFETDDETVFGQVRRALLRALERQRERRQEQWGATVL